MYIPLILETDIGCIVNNLSSLSRTTPLNEESSTKREVHDRERHDVHVCPDENIPDTLQCTHVYRTSILYSVQYCSFVQYCSALSTAMHVRSNLFTNVL